MKVLWIELFRFIVKFFNIYLVHICVHQICIVHLTYSYTIAWGKFPKIPEICPSMFLSSNLCIKNALVGRWVEPQGAFLWIILQMLVHTSVKFWKSISLTFKLSRMIVCYVSISQLLEVDALHSLLTQCIFPVCIVNCSEKIYVSEK